jgi:hypothetical protein
MTINTNNTIIDSKIIVGRLEIRAQNVQIRNSYLTEEDGIALYCDDGNAGCSDGLPTIIEDSELDCTGNGASGTVGRGTAITEGNFIIRRVDIHGCENGLSLTDKVLIEDSYIHDLYNDLTPGPLEAHADGIQFSGSHTATVGSGSVPGAKDITIRHNTILGSGWDNTETLFTQGTSAIITNRGPTNIDNNILIEKNLMAGGGYTIYCEQDGFTAINERVINNHFSTRYAPTVGEASHSVDCSDESNISGNVIDETDAPISLN